MGITSFLRHIEVDFLNQLDDQDFPRGIDTADWDAVQAWYNEAFAKWFLKNRETALSWEWIRRGWADYVIQPSVPGHLRESYRVKPEFVEEIDAWLQDERD